MACMSRATRSRSRVDIRSARTPPSALHARGVLETWRQAGRALRPVARLARPLLLSAVSPVRIGAGPRLMAIAGWRPRFLAGLRTRGSPQRSIAGLRHLRARSGCDSSLLLRASVVARLVASSRLHAVADWRPRFLAGLQARCSPRRSIAGLRHLRTRSGGGSPLLL